MPLHKMLFLITAVFVCRGCWCDGKRSARRRNWPCWLRQLL